MLNHVLVGSSDLERSKHFYDAVLGVLGAGEPARFQADGQPVRLIYRHEGSSFGIGTPANGQAATNGNGSTIAFRCSSAEQVQQFHDTAVANGGSSIEDMPGLRDTNMGPVFLAYVRDPDGNKLCATYRA